ncbi:MAG TPA: glycosyltransferase family A protein [Bryobacteraceae bacterium]|nr:glycosyltransferase family A protein [Bryobacteraceae bacterium]
MAIGRNEGERLRVSLSSALQQCQRVVFVDSGSTDGSASLARSLGTLVVELDDAAPYTAARARNAGFAHAAVQFPDLDAVQFLDGDCELAEGWLERAAPVLESHPQVAAVFGRRREVHPERSIFAKICDLEWDGPKGEAAYFGGDVLLRTSVFREAGGFDASLIAGEEPELCVRIRRQGWKILRIDAEMTAHDVQIAHFAQWWKRSVRTGHAYAEGAWMHGLSPQRHWLRETISVCVWGALLPAFAAASLALAPAATLAIALCYPAFGLRIYMRARRGGMNTPDARLYAAACVIAKFPQAVGQIRFLLGRLARRPSRLIEYKPT